MRYGVVEQTARGLVEKLIAKCLCGWVIKKIRKMLQVVVPC